MSVQQRNELCSCGSGKKYKKCCMGKHSAARFPLSSSPPEGERDKVSLRESQVDAATPTADQSVQIGLVHHQAGRLEQANEAYQQALQANPDHPDALHLLGMLAHQIGDQPLAVELINRAISLSPNSPNYHCNLGTVLQAQGKSDEAIACFRQALTIEANNTVFHYNLGHALQAKGELAAAVASYRAAISLAPNHLESHSNLGHTLRALGELDQAVACYHQAIAIAPNLAEMHFNLGTALGAQGKLEVASESYRHAIALFPDYAQAHCNLGALLLAQNKFDDAVASYQRAIAISPDFGEAHYNLGIALQAQNKLDDAIASYRRTLELQPNFVEGYCNLGNALRAQGRLPEAVECYQKALAIKPDYANAYSNLLFLQSYHAETSAAEYLTQARGWELACVPAAIRQAAREKTFARLPLSGRRLKVGYVSGDFRKHAVSYFIEQIFAQNDSARIELFAYSNNRFRDTVTERLNTLVDHWIPIAALSDVEVCTRMEADQLDVLIDLSAHSAHNRLGVFARRAAPVQATYLYFASTGLTEMDYWIGDEMLTPPELDEQFSEQVWRLPRTWLSYKTITDAPASNWHPSNDGTIWLGSFNNLGKITPLTLRLWAQILQALPESRLLLKNKELADSGNQQRVLTELAAHGIAADRIDLQPGTDWLDYMAQHDRLDIALDPVGGHGGGTSTCDALWMGVPVIHLLGEHVGSRFAASLLNAVGHSEWIARSEAEYIEKVISLARNVELRKQLRSSQRDTMARSPLCDAHGLAHALEEAYASMFTRWYDSKFQ
jgi:predicted O-linked N-acetylglucosamine transferase (SPINDLY family)